MEKKDTGAGIIFLIILIIGICLALIGFMFYMLQLKGEAKVYDNSTSKINVENIVDEEGNEPIEDYFILYKGFEINLTTGSQSLKDMTINDENINKYNTTYYNYNEGKYIGETEGEFGESTATYEGVALVDNVEKLAISQNDNICPRGYKRITVIPEELKSLNERFNDVKIQSIDLDDDGKEEKIVCMTKTYDEETKETVAYSEISLYDSDNNKIATLVKIEDGFEADLSRSGDTNNAAFLSFDLVDYVDIDLDGNMEIIINLLCYEGDTISIYKYTNGIVEGEVEINGYIGV